MYIRTKALEDMTEAEYQEYVDYCSTDYYFWQTYSEDPEEPSTL